MLTDTELQELVEDLHSQDLSLRVAALKDLWQYPSGDARILPYLEALLEDKTLCIIMLPYQYGEIRWLAAHALAAERTALGIQEPVKLLGVIRPLDTQEFVAVSQAAGVEYSGGVEGVLATLAILRGRDQLPLDDLKLMPSNYQLAGV